MADTHTRILEAQKIGNSAKKDGLVFAMLCSLLVLLYNLTPRVCKSKKLPINVNNIVNGWQREAILFFGAKAKLKITTLNQLCSFKFPGKFYPPFYWLVSFSTHSECEGQS